MIRGEWDNPGEVVEPGFDVITEIRTQPIFVLIRSNDGLRGVAGRLWLTGSEG